MNPTRITVAFDQSTANLLDKISKERGLSQSEIMRRALRFYYENRAIENDTYRKKLYIYMDLLLGGEHVILDVDHWLLFLKLAESSLDNETFWAEHRDVARSHTEQLKTKVLTAEELLERLEACNFFRVTKDSDNNFTLVLGSELPKKFVKIFLEEYFAGMGVNVEIKENLAKIRVTVKR
jgi:hypothetical protein